MKVDDITLPPKPRRWFAALVALAIFAGIGTVVVWNWLVLDRDEQRESRQRFAVDVRTIGEQVQARMRAYEMVLRGVSSAFAGAEIQVTYAQWREMADQLQVRELYPGISSVVWSRYLRAEERDAWIRRARADGRPDFTIFPDGQRADYQIIKYIDPINERTSRVAGLDILTQFPQNRAIRDAIDSGQPTLSMPLRDLYTVSPDDPPQTGILMYFPVYRTGIPPDTVAARRAAIIGMSNAAFRGQELANGIFGAQLELFQIAARDVGTNQPLFDSRDARPPRTPPGWKPQFHQSLEVPLYGRVWHLDVTGTPAYESGLLSRSQNLVLWMGLSAGALMAFLGGGFVYQRERQMYAREQVAVRLRDQARQLMLANRYKSEFLANMSHELRTPLNSILILSDQLRQNAAGNLSEKQARHADIIHRAGNDLLQLINDVLDLAKIEAGRIQVTVEPLGLRDVLVDLDAAMRPLADSKGLTLSIAQPAADSGVPARIETDPVRLNQILRNLVSNAIKFTNTGTVRVEVSAGRDAGDGRIGLAFAVSDTGIGIDPAQHAQVFEAFRQLDGSTRRRFGGTGLGLAITRQLVQALDGEIELDSTPGEGSTFRVTLPVKPVAAPAHQDTAPQRSGKGPALLIVEDDANFAAIIIEQAHSHGFSSVHCVSGEQALDVLRSESFAAIILDILLPDLSGWQLFRRLRAEPLHRHTPVHIISCLPQPAGQAPDHGTRYLTKPIARDALEAVFSSLRPGGTRASDPALLLVEDVTEERDHYRQRLAALGFAVTGAGSAREACAAWAAGTFDVLVVDLNLPDQDGFALLDTLAALRPLGGTRVVVNTGVDLTREGLQRLSAYSATVVPKHGADTAALGRAVQGFLGQLGNAASAAATATTADADADADAGSGLGSPAALSPSPAAASTIAPLLAGHRLLLVDDDVRNVYAMSAILDDFGLDVTAAGNGEEAIAAYRNEAFDVILMDMSMPVMDGYTATNLLKTEHACTIPIVALTAHAMKGDREKCLAAGADDYMAKPVKSQDLRALLERWLLPAAGT